MATYKIKSRRKKAPAAPALPEIPATAAATMVASSAPTKESGDAAFKLYEEFFHKEDAAPQTGDAALISTPESAAAEKPEAQGCAPVPAEDGQPAFADTQDEEEDPAPEEHSVGDLLNTLFPDEKEKKRGLFAKKKDVPAPTAPVDVSSLTSTPPTDVSAPIPAVPSEGGAGDTIRIPPIPSAPAAVEDPTVQAAVGTRVTISDLVTDAAPAAKETAVAAPAAEEEGFSRPEQADGLLVEYRRRKRSLVRRLIFSFVLFFAALYAESVCYTPFLRLPHPDFLTPGRFGLVFLLLDLQLLVLAVAAAAREVKNGFAGLFSGKAGPDSIASVALTVALLQDVFLLVFFRTETSYVLFGSVALFLAALAILRSLLELSAEMRALALLSAPGEKYAASRQEGDCPELAAFSAYLGEEPPEVFTVTRTEFALGFTERTKKTSGTGAIFTVGIPILTLLAVGVGVWCYLGGAHSAIDAADAFVCSMMMGLPACSVFAFTLPFFFGSRAAAKEGTALVGEASVEESVGAEIVSFDDSEVFLPKHVKVTSVRTFGSARIDKILIYCAQIFRVVGGPLSYVFENSISSLSVPGHVEITENDGNGIVCRIDGHEIAVGGAAFLESRGCTPEPDASDPAFENAVGRIMYLSSDGELCAKFYIRYAVSARFADQLARLNRAGIYAAVKTCDPNVDAALLSKILHTGDFPIGVIKTGTAAKNAPAEAPRSAPIVSTRRPSGALGGFLICDAVRQRVVLNTLVKFVSMLLGLFIAFILTGLQNAYLTPTVCLGYQLLWIVPVLVPALFDWPKLKRRKKHSK